MNRKKFLKNSLLTGLATAVGTPLLASKEARKSTYDKLREQVGFNHLPNKEQKTMNTVLHKAETRGHANHGWLDSHHTFSFANYHNPERMNFGVLRVLNDDVVTGGKGFGQHPHDNMEIVSIPLSGNLLHRDSMGNVATIRQGDVQVMSAGTGVQHSEYNEQQDEEVRFLQIWMFPRERGVNPRYDQVSVRDIAKKNTFYQVLSPNKEDAGVWVNQDAWFHLAEFDKNASDTYTIKKHGNGAYFFVLEGSVEIAGQKLEKRDGFGIWDADSAKVSASKGAKVLVMDVPMTMN